MSTAEAPATPTLDVVALGNALVDVLAHAPDAFLAEHDLVKGSMALTDAATATRLYAAMGPGVEVSGGSAANTMVGIASFALQPDGWVVLHAGRALKGIDGNEFATLVAGVGRFGRFPLAIQVFEDGVGGLAASA